MLIAISLYSVFVYQAQALMSKNLRGVKVYTRPFKPSTNRQTRIQQLAQQQLGIPYHFGGHSPRTGFDCSGLVQYVYQQSVAMKLPRTSAGLSKIGRPVEIKQLKTGDLVFFNTTGKPYSHVGIYLDNNRFIHAPKTGKTVNIQNLSKPYWDKRYQGARRVLLP